uniref:Uncharacterized protein n=1 Tax=Anguilla anguilla TaxID=7936 RepID=A0A0E9W6N3_ANGAN
MLCFFGNSVPLLRCITSAILDLRGCSSL